MMLGRKANKLGLAAANEFAARLMVQELMVATLFGSSLAAMSPEGAAHVRAELAERLAIAAAPTSAAFFATAAAAAASMLAMVEACERDARERCSKAAAA